MLYLIIAAAIAVADQLFKQWITSSIELFGMHELLPGIVNLTYIQNTGAAFSIFEDMRWILAGASFVMAVVIIIFLFKSKMNAFGKITAAAVLGGAVGNLIDRVRLGYVVDMFRTEFIDFPVFNIADCFIVVGVIAFFVYYLFVYGKEELASRGETLMPEIERLTADGQKKNGETLTLGGSGDFAEPEEEKNDGADG